LYLYIASVNSGDGMPSVSKTPMGITGFTSLGPGRTPSFTSRMMTLSKDKFLDSSMPMISSSSTGCVSKAGWRSRGDEE
jgi:hypothetical protein